MASLADLKSNASGTKEVNPIVRHKQYLAKRRDQMSAGIASHMSVDRLLRSVDVAMMQNRQLQECSELSIYQSVSVAANLGLEIVGGQGYLVPYKGTCTFVPGWQGLVDLVSRTGRATVWTGAVFDGDVFDYALGDSPFIRHQPQGEDDPAKITHVYAVGRVKGAEWPIIEVWTMPRVQKHLKKYNKVGARHYAFDNMEMYARKVVLLQVLKYMPKSQELNNAIMASTAADTGERINTIDGIFTVVPEDDQQGAQQQGQDDGASDQQMQRDEPQRNESQREATQRNEPQDSPRNNAPVDTEDDKIEAALRNAKDMDTLDIAADLIGEATRERQPALNTLYRERRAELNAPRRAARQTQMSID